jgi:HK97 gp10 family phage protein
MKISSGVSGGAALQAKFASLPATLVQSVMRKAVRQGANLITARAKENFSGAVEAIGGARSDTLNPHTISGALRASIRTTERKGTPTRVVFNVVAGELSGAQRSKFGADSAFYAMFVEKGHINRKMGQALRGSRAFVLHSRQTSESNTPAHPFLAPAVASEAGAVIELISGSIASQIGDL